MTRIQQQHRSLQHPVIEEQGITERLTANKQKMEKLTSVVADLKIEHAEKKSKVDKLSNSLRERNSSRMVSVCVCML